VTIDDKARNADREPPSRPRELVVVQPLRDWTCSACGGTGGLLTMEIGTPPTPLCMDCADLEHLVFLAAGDAALTRRAKAASGLFAVVVRFSRSRGRYERQGVLVEEDALAAAEQRCLVDEDARARRRERDAQRRAAADVRLHERFAERIRERFPGCPPERAAAITRHAVARGSGRVGRTAAGRAVEDRAVELAVIAAIRHTDTRYDELLMSGIDRNDARSMVRDAVDAVLARWQTR
jgi:hypothetical protein